MAERRQEANLFGSSPFRDAAVTRANWRPLLPSATEFGVPNIQAAPGPRRVCPKDIEKECG